MVHQKLEFILSLDIIFPPSKKLVRIHPVRTRVGRQKRRPTEEGALRGIILGVAEGL